MGRREHGGLHAPEVAVELPPAEERERQQRAPGRSGAASPSRPRPRRRAPPGHAPAAPPPRLSRPRGRGSATSSSASTRPGRRESTTTRSPSTIASSTSWVTSSTVRGSRARLRASHCCISPRVIASSPAKGSSRHSRRLPHSSVRANATRWRIPPGELFRAGVLEALQTELAEQLAGARAGGPAALPRQPQAEGRVLERVEPRQQQVALGHQHRRRARDRPAVGPLQPAHHFQQRGLAAAARAHDRHELAGAGRAARPRREPAPALPARRGMSARARRPRAPRVAARQRSRAGTSGGAPARDLVAVITSTPFAGITPQVRRVDAGGSVLPVRHLSQPARQHPWCVVSAGAMLAPALVTGRVSARTKSSSWAVVQHSNAMQYCS